MKIIGNKSGAIVLLLAGSLAQAGTLTIPNTFTAGTPAKAAEVNQNFTAVKAAVDSNAADITSLSSQSTSLATRVTTLESSAQAPSLKVRAKSDNSLLGYVAYSGALCASYTMSGNWRLRKPRSQHHNDNEEGSKI